MRIGDYLNMVIKALFLTFVISHSAGRLKMLDWKTRDQIAGVENAGLENMGPNLQQDEIYYFQFGGFSGTLTMAAQTVNNYRILI